MAGRISCRCRQEAEEQDQSDPAVGANERCLCGCLLNGERQESKPRVVRCPWVAGYPRAHNLAENIRMLHEG